MNKRTFSGLLLIISIGLAAHPWVLIAQIQLENSHTAEYYIKNVLLGSGVEVGNITHVGMVGGLGQFNADKNIIGVKSGIVLSTGNTDSLKGPNNYTGYTSLGELPKNKEEWMRLRKGDRDLNKLCRRRTVDITVIEFDFVPVNNVLEFNYVFGSEEYKEYVGSMFNDVFGFFLSGPGIKKKKNLAVLPNSNIPISINTVNHRKNKFYFRDNTGKIKAINKILLSRKELNRKLELKKQLQLDGLTTILKVKHDVIPYRKYHIKIAIGDVSDAAYDSAVFLEAGSFASIQDTGGKYYDTIVKFETTKPDIESILFNKNKVAADSISEHVSHETFEITDVFFDNDSYVIPDSGKVQLDGLAEHLLTNRSFSCTLWGYTDSVGTKKYNQNLSEMRAITVKKYLASKGIEESRLNYQGYSYENPKSDNATDEGRARNRRVEIIVFEENRD